MDAFSSGLRAPTLELPVRSTVVIGPVYLQGAVTVGIDFPTENAKLWHEQYPENEDLEREFRSELALTLGVSF